MHTLDFLDFISIPKKIIVLILSNRCGMVGVGLGELRKGKNELSKKKEYFWQFKLQWSKLCFWGSERRRHVSDIWTPDIGIFLIYVPDIVAFLMSRYRVFPDIIWKPDTLDEIQYYWYIMILVLVYTRTNQPELDFAYGQARLYQYEIH